MLVSVLASVLASVLVFLLASELASGLVFLLASGLASVLASWLASVLACRLAHWALEALLLLKACIQSACPACKLGSHLRQGQRKLFAKRPRCSLFQEPSKDPRIRLTHLPRMTHCLCSQASPGIDRHRVDWRSLCSTLLCLLLQLGWRGLLHTPSPH